MNYNKVKTADLVALAGARAVEIVKDDGKVDRAALIGALTRDDLEQGALAEDAANAEHDEPDAAAGTTGSEALSDASAAAAASSEAQATDQGQPKPRAAKPRKLPKVGAQVHVQFPSGLVEPAVVLSHEGGELLEMRCVSPGGKTYHRSGCGRWAKGSRDAGWK